MKPYGAPTANQAWIELLRKVSGTPAHVSPRGMATREILGCKTVFDMKWPVITVAKRKLGYRFLAAEAAWIMSGDNRVATIAPYAKHIADFSDDGVYFFGAYGPKIIQQLPHILKSLTADRDTRQAVISIWRENPPQTKDVPCTITVQWFIRNGLLHCMMNMRSSDVWLGVPYDWFNFSMMSMFILKLLNNIGGMKLELGDMHFYAGSQHLYSRNEADVHDCIVDDSDLFVVYTALTTDLFEDHLDVNGQLWKIANRDFSGVNYLTELMDHAAR